MSPGLIESDKTGRRAARVARNRPQRTRQPREQNKQHEHDGHCVQSSRAASFAVAALGSSGPRRPSCSKPIVVSQTSANRYAAVSGLRSVNKPANIKKYAMIISTSWSRWCCDSRNFSATMTTSRALPASTPLMVR